MLSRSDSLTVTVAAPPRERFAFPHTAAAAARSTEPEVFTFERIPAAATALRSYVPIRPKRRCTRVMYPAKVRMHLPPPERSAAKRWLLLLVLVVLWQIYTEDPCADAPSAAAADAPIAGDYQGFSSSSSSSAPAAQPAAAEDAAASAAAAAAAAAGGTCAKSGQSSEGSRPYEQSAGMVALLVYHRLGADN